VQKIIRCYAEGGFVPTFRNQYTRWKFGKPKHIYYVKNRRRDVKILDTYDRYILDNLRPGTTLVFDSAGYYLDGIVPNLQVVDLDPVVLTWYPQARIMTSEESIQDLYRSADNFVTMNTIKLRFKTWDFYEQYWAKQSRFMRDGCQVFFAFRDIFMNFNKLKYSFESRLQAWLHAMQQHGYHVRHYSYDPIPVTEHMTELTEIPEIDDMVNGNVKIHWEYRCR